MVRELWMYGNAKKATLILEILPVSFGKKAYKDSIFGPIWLSGPCHKLKLLLACSFCMFKSSFSTDVCSWKNVFFTSFSFATIFCRLGGGRALLCPRQNWWLSRFLLVDLVVYFLFNFIGNNIFVIFFVNDFIRRSFGFHF